MNKRAFIKNLGSVSLGLAAAGAVSAAAPSVGQAAAGFTPEPVTREQRRRNRFPNVPLVTHDGRIVRFYDDLIQDKTVLINFMFATCNDTCPMTTVNLKKVQEHLADRMGKDVFMYSITLAPEHDTHDVLKAYAELFKIKDGWTFLTGTAADIEKLRIGLGFQNRDPKLDQDRTRHTGMVRFGFEPLERWAGAPAMTNPKYLAEYVRWLEPRGRKPQLAELMG